MEKPTLAPKLDVMICTYGSDCMDKISRMQLPEVNGVRYIVSAQTSPIAIPSHIASRQDIEVHFTSSKGLSNNRNNALSFVTAPYCYVCDDDITLFPNGLRSIISEFDSNPEIDIITMRDVSSEKVYPSEKQSLLSNTKNYYISSIEIALRTESVKATGVRFSPLLGIGAPYLGAGEEDILIFTLIHRYRLKGCFIPIDIASHYGISTGNRPGAPSLRAQGASIMLRHPFTFLPRALLKSLRTKHTPAPKTILYLLQGGIYFLANRKKILGM